MWRKMVIAFAAALLSLSFQAKAAVANLIANGGFETGDFTSWTATTNIGIDSNAIDAKSGRYSAVWNDASPATLSQTLNTVNGQGYTVDFWASVGAGYSNENPFFTVKFGNSVLTDIRDLSDPANWSVNYQHFVFGVTGSGNDTLMFGVYSPESEGWLDDVSVTPVPIPGALWLLGSGLFGLVGLRRKLAKA